MGAGPSPLRETALLNLSPGDVVRFPLELGVTSWAVTSICHDFTSDADPLEIDFIDGHLRCMTLTVPAKRKFDPVRLIEQRGRPA
jgi:hypothetical protein